MVSRADFPSQCPGCEMNIPRYVGEQPKRCPSCGADLQEGLVKYAPGMEPEPGASPLVCRSYAPRIQRVIDEGKPEACEAADVDPSVFIPAEVLDQHFDGGHKELRRLLEQTGEDDLYFRMESPFGPVLIFEFVGDACRAYWTDCPEDSIGFDPRDELIEDGGWDEDGWAELDEAAPSRASMKRPHEPGRRGTYRVHGGFRFTIGGRKGRPKSHDPEGNVQRRRAARKRASTNSMSTARALKKYHDSPEGREMHRRLADYNRHRMRDVKKSRKKSVHELRKRARDLLASLKSGRTILENWETHTGYVAPPQEPTADDVYQNVLRKLIYMESLDTLEDVSFDDYGSLYMFFDPTLTRREIDEIIRMINGDKIAQQEETVLVASPDQSIPEESASSDWWVAFLPGKTEDGTPAEADPAEFGVPGDAEPPKQQMVVKGITDIDKMTQNINTKKLLKGLGERQAGAPGRWLSL